MFYSISKDGLVKHSNRLSDLPRNEAILCYLKEVENSKDDYKTQNGNQYSWYRYEFVDSLGNPTNFKWGTCEVTFIEHDDGSYYLRGRKFTIRDQYGREGDFGISGTPGDFAYHHFDKIATQLLPFMMKLSSFGGWDGYMFHLYPECPNAIRVIWGSHKW